MANFTRIRDFGTWVDGSALLPSEMELFDAHQSKAINGAEGGVYAPDDPVEIGGDGGLKVTGPCVVTSEAQLQGGATITGGDLSVAQDATIQGTLDVEGLATVDELAVVNGANVQGNAAVQGALAVTGNIGTDGDVFCERVAIHGSHLGGNILSVNGAARVTGALTVDSDSLVDADLEVANNLTVGGVLDANLASSCAVTGPINCTGTGRIRKRYLSLSDADTTIDADTCDIAQMSGATMSANRTVVVTTTGAAAGDMLVIATDEITHSLYVRLNSLVGTLVATLINGTTRAVVLIHDGTTWRSLFTA